MYYTVTSPTDEVDRTYLYPSAHAAQAVARDGRPVYEVAVDFDAWCRRVVPLWVDAREFDPAWTSPAEFRADGSVIAKGPIPAPLFVGCLRVDEAGVATPPPLLRPRSIQA